MKKIILILILLLITPTLVNASSTINTSFDDEKCVLTISGTQTGHEATISLFDKDDELIGFKTSEIKNGNYSIDFVLTYDSDKKVNITLSNESGTNEFSKDNVSISACTKNEENKENEEIKNKNYVVSDDNDNSASFKEEEGHTYTLSVFDFVGLTDEELETFEISKKEYDLAFAGIVNATKENGTLISFFNIEIMDEDNRVITEGPINIKIKMTEEMKKYNVFKMIYVDMDNNFHTEDPITLTVNGDYLEGTLNHLSTYALVGTKSEDNNSENIKTNPKTVDNIMFDVAILDLSIIGFIGVGFYIKKKKFN